MTAHLHAQRPDVRAEIRTGLFGDLVGNIERVDLSSIDVLAVMLEWADLDPRLGIRSLGGWRQADVDDIAASAEVTAARLQRAIAAISGDLATIVCLPTLPLPPAFTTRPLQLSSHEARLHRIVASLVESILQFPQVRIINQQKLALDSPLANRYDVKSDLQTGFPYTLEHASILGELFGGLIDIRTPMKGIITDLDDTLWAGIVGDDGVDAISWNLDGHSQVHGLYQQLLSSLASAGVLIGVASKNQEEVVKQAFQRRDLLLSSDDIFPLEIHWLPKSESVERILRTWNIGADSVVFVDDSPAELAEVQAAFPDMLCRQFPKDDPRKAWKLLNELRDLFGKPVISKEDTLRMRSIRTSAALGNHDSGRETVSDDFLRSADSCIVFDYGRSAADNRALELVNKTNQFNLNGKRYSETEWRQFFDDPAGFLLTATYEDKFGALGKIAVLTGTAKEGCIDLRTWVMSCRAFSRGIEHQCLRYLFEDCGANQITFDFQPTIRNGPLQDYLTGLVDRQLSAPVILTKERFFAGIPPLFHRVEVNSRV
ncbi:MAG: HAD-IIIC family phosphatase [Terracidiphilus sp.]